MTMPEAYDPLAPEVKQHSQEVFETLRAQCPVHHHRMPSSEMERQEASYLVAEPTTEFWSVFRYEDAVRILHDPETFSSKEGPGPERMAQMSPDGMLLTADEPAHRRQRQIANKAFLPRMVTQRLPLVRTVIDDLIDKVAARGQCDLMTEISFPLTVAMITDFFGAGGERRGDITRWGAASIALMGGDAKQLEAGTVATLELFGFLSGIITERRAALAAGQKLSDDVLSAMIIADHEGSSFKDEEILMAAHQFLTAGFESTATAIGNGIHLLCANPEERAKLEADWSLIDSAAEEVLRCEAPVEGTFRTTTKPVTIAGEELPAGAKVRVVYASAGRDSARFEDAGSFRVDRPMVEVRGHLAFAVGPHSCLGSALARAELKVAIETVLRRLPGLRLDPDQPPTRSTALTVNGFTNLPVVWDPAQARPRLWGEG
jgi:cytochrome P450